MSLEVHTADLRNAGASESEIGEIESFFRSKFEGARDVHKVYLSPSASWSDTCDHHEPHRDLKCHVNGVSFLVGPDAPLSKLVTSKDLYGSIAFYNIKDFTSSINTALTPEQKVALTEIHISKKIGDIKGYVSNVFASQDTKTARTAFMRKVFDEKEIDDSFSRSLESASKVGTKNGFIILGRYRSFENGVQVSKFFLAIRSYDEISSKNLFDSIHARDIKVGSLKTDPTTQGLCRVAMSNSEINQGSIALTIIRDILGFNVNVNDVYSGEFKRNGNISYVEHMKADHRFMYNMFARSPSHPDKIVYYDHCFDTSQVAEAGFWPFFRGREHGLDLIRDPSRTMFSSSFIWSDRLETLPMGVRKAIHRRQYTLETNLSKRSREIVIPEEDYNPHLSSVLNHNIVSFGDGKMHYKLVDKKYHDMDLENAGVQIYGISKGLLDIRHVDIWASFFSQEFGIDYEKTFTVMDLLLQTTSEDDIGISINDPFFNEHIHNIFKYTIDKCIILNDMIPRQNFGEKVFIFNKANLLGYLRSQGNKR
jgi:hypothetical protein